jgi:2-phosphosulfolactate phosphatase
MACASGRELVERGFASDVEIAGELDATDRVPLLERGVFEAASAA